MLITRSAGAKAEIEKRLRLDGFTDVSVHGVEIDRDGVKLSVDGKNVDIAQN